MTASVGGGSSTTQSSGETGPWAPTVPYVTGPGGLLPSIGTQPFLLNGVAAQMAGNQAWDANNLMGVTKDYIDFLDQNNIHMGQDLTKQVPGFLSGDPFGYLKSGYQNYSQQLQPFLDPANLDPGKNPYTASIIDTIKQTIGDQVNASAAASGRDLSGMNSKALGLGEGQALASALFGQYNTNVGNMLGSAGNLYSAGNNTGGAMANNVVTGANLGMAAPSLATNAAQHQLNIASQLYNLPYQNIAANEALMLPLMGSGSTNIEKSSTNSMNYGLSGGAGSLGGMGAGKSDIRLKRDIVPVGRYKDFKLYKFRYLDDDQVYVGVMAHEVKAIDPDAVEIGEDGFMRVKYNRLGMRLLTGEEWDARAL